MINVRHELILIRAGNDNNCLVEKRSRIGARARYIQDTIANATCVIERDEYAVVAVCFGKRTILQHEFSLVGFVRVSIFAAYNQAFVDH